MTRGKNLRNTKENQNKFGSGLKIHSNNGNFDMFNNENIMRTENRFPMNYFHDIDQSCVDQLKEYLKNRRSGINSYRGMTDNSTNQPAAVKNKLIKIGLLSHHQQQQQAVTQPKASLLKQPLSSLNTNNNILNTQNNNYYYDQQHYLQAKAQPQQQRQHRHNLNDLSDDALKSDVQIVLNNIQNAILNQQKQQQQEFYQDRFQYLNIFGGQSPPTKGNGIKQARNLTRKMSASPADCDNTNNNNMMGPTSMLGCSFASDFTHDNSDYQWFIDYGYRDGVQHHSILSSLSASYNGIGELSYYDDLARNIDANLAEVDMENFRSEDIHSLLKMRQDDINGINPTRLLLKDQNELENSICKSEILFSPVKESHISVDSLDMDGYPDDIILTCQANKNNYTIAFEGSCMYSDESYYDIPDNGRLKHNSINIDNMMNNKKTIDGDMTQSDIGLTTWSQLKKSNDHIHMHRYPSGNNNNQNTTNCNTNNNINNNNTINTCTHYLDINVRKSSSMPNLKAILQQQQALQHQQQNVQLNVSEVASSQSSMDTESKNKTMLHLAPIASSESDSHSPAPNDHSNSNNERVTNPPSLNLVKLFIKQKSSSSDTCMDVSSGCWPSDSTNSSTEHPGNCSNSSLNRLRKKSMNDSGKFSALSKHEEDAEYQLDSLDAHMNQQQGNERKTNDFNREIFDSPTHRRHYRDCALNIRNQMKNPLLFNVLNNNTNASSRSQSEASRTSENLTQILKHEDKVTVPIDMITKSIQTSSILMSNTESTKKLPQSHVTMVPPSFLSQLSKLGDQQQAPVYVIYPNYALPDLEFINNQPINLKKDIIMSPLNYQQPKMSRTLELRQQQRPISFRKRPQSLDIDRLQQNQYSHVQDWKSLLTLLPRDYKKLLKNIPEVNKITTMEASISSQKPLFCMTPPIRRTTAGLICDCQTLLQNQTVNSSSSGGSSQKGSSGYRGSSTMLTDSEMEEIIKGGGSGNDAMRNMFVYQYDNVPDLEQRPPTGQRRGILRRTNTTTNTPTRVTNATTQKQKRYSMLDQPKSPQQHMRNPPATQTQQEKRRSLQEPNFYHTNDLEEYFNNIGIGGTKNFANRLPNYMKTRDDQRDNAKDLNQLLTELELNKALSNKLNYGGNQNGTDVDIQEIEARLKAESFLNAIPKTELRNFADITQILEWNQGESDERSKLRSEVSKTLSSRKVSFNHPTPTPPSPVRNAKTHHLQAPEYEKKFTTPPNSPQMSQLVDKKSPVDKKQQQQRLEKEKQDKIQSNRFRRLQIQWELLSKETPPITESKSNVTTPTGSKCQSKIPRPVSYPNPKSQNELVIGGKNLRSPSKMTAPKKYTTTPTNVTSPTAMLQQTPRTPNKQIHTTPKKTLPAR
ncbi:hypothetical protein PVAND_002869 [Polypedilum vanderplanki]|uniref:Uncharacterized protein n=1 Tax=Polypedilum vanderplanki TaxID=319348 RepID=A0A9J6BTZ8_POLVA|nr:hypothetical protein PVAND_002869 [Polypedilum vanderplanki]